MGLKYQFERLNLPCQVKPILGFKEGLGEEDIWKNFKLIFECLQEKDEVWLERVVIEEKDGKKTMQFSFCRFRAYPN